MSLRTLIVDDEPVALRRLGRLLAACPDVEVVGQAANGPEARDLIATLQPDLLMLDIEMPGQTGLALAAQLTAETAPVVIFVTAYSQYALDAIGLDSADYLLKPIEPDRLEAAIARARRRLTARTAADRETELQAVVSALRRRLVVRAEDELFWVRDGRTSLRIPMSSILWLEAERDYVRIHTEARSLLVRGQLGDFEARLPALHFKRVHRSAIVRLAAILEVRPKGDRTMLLKVVGGHEVTASRSFAHEMRRLRVGPS